MNRPKFKQDDLVTFKTTWTDGTEKVITGKVAIVDTYGTFEQNEEPSYDIMAELEPGNEKSRCLFKHIRESGITAVPVEHFADI